MSIDVLAALFIYRQRIQISEDFAVAPILL